VKAETSTVRADTITSGMRVNSPSRMKCTVLLVDDEPVLRAMARSILGGDYHFHVAESAEEAQEICRREAVEIVLCDQQLPGLQGIPFLEWVKNHDPRAVRILMTGLYSLDQAVDAINDGIAQRFLFKPWRPDQIVTIVRNAARLLQLEHSHENLLDELKRFNTELEGRVADRTRELQEANKMLQSRNLMLQRMALTDALTGLPNRRAIDRLAKNELLRRARTPSPLAIGLVDADFFKDINTQYLLPGGDHVLIWLGQTLVNAVRTIDTVARVGGEEFLVLAPDTNLEGARILAERIRKNVEDGHTIYQGQRIQITVSIGMVVVDGVLGGYDQMRQEAAAALSRAKKEGRNRSDVVEVSKFVGPSST
jgi:diguanylate cyclase